MFCLTVLFFKISTKPAFAMIALWTLRRSSHTVKATDMDSDDNGRVDYQLQDSSDFFIVGSTDGGIRLKATPPSGRFFSLLLRSISKTSEHF